MIPNSAFGFARRHPVVSSQVVEHAPAPPADPIDPLRDGDSEPLHPAGERLNVVAFDQRVHVIALHREVRHPKAVLLVGDLTLLSRQTYCSDLINLCPNQFRSLLSPWHQVIRLK